MREMFDVPRHYAQAVSDRSGSNQSIRGRNYSANLLGCRGDFSPSVTRVQVNSENSITVRLLEILQPCDEITFLLSIV